MASSRIGLSGSPPLPLFPSSGVSPFSPPPPPSVRFAPAPPPAPLRSALARVAPLVKDGDELEEEIRKAQEVCAGNEGSGECAAAWDTVEEISAAKANRRTLKSKLKDPLEDYCKEFPEAGECRMYDV